MLKVLKKITKKFENFLKYKEIFIQNGYELFNDKDKYFLKGNNINFTSFSNNICFTAKSVLLNKEYDFSIKEPFIMIDIGFNIGITSLNFAQNENIKKIYGFEPFVPTYKNAVENLDLNPLLSKKIQLYNYGLGKDEKVINVSYEKNKIGSMSTVVDRFKNTSKNIEKVVIKSAAEELTKILEKHPEKIFLKIDCEGAEHEIIPSLYESEILKKIDVLIMEWHFMSPEKILHILNKNGFFTFCNHEIPNQVGIIRAVKINNAS